ncbi:hypothetical protein RB597_007812 [Gaeumannomyces tritici]
MTNPNQHQAFHMVIQCDCVPPQQAMASLTSLDPKQSILKETALDTLTADFSLPSNSLWRWYLREWAFGRRAEAAFLEYRDSFLIPSTAKLQDTPVPTPYEVADMELNTSHVFAGADKAGFTANDYALRFCFELLHASSAHGVWNPLCDATPPKKAADDWVDFFKPGTAAVLERELKKLGRVEAPPAEDKLFGAAVGVLRVWIEEWKVGSHDYAAFLRATRPPLRESRATANPPPTKVRSGISPRMTRSRTAKLKSLS